MSELAIPTSLEDAQAMSVQTTNDQLQFLQNISSEYGKKSGQFAIDNLRDYDAKIKDFDDRLKKELGPDAFHDYLTMQAPHRKAERDAIERVARHEAIQASDENNKAKALLDVQSQLREDSMVFGADIAEISSKRAETHKKFTSGLEKIDSDLENGIKKLRDDKSLDDKKREDEIAKLQMVAVQAKAEHSKMSNSAYAELDAEEQKKMFAFIPKIKDFSTKLFTDRYTYLMMRGDYSPVQAYADACESTRHNMIEYFKNFIAAGNYKGIGPILKEMERLDVENFKKSKKEVDENGNLKHPNGSYNIFDLACCRNTDFKALIDSAQASIDEEVRRNKADIAAQNAARQENDDRLARQADTLELKAKEYFYKNLATDSNPLQSVASFLPAIQKLKDAGYKDAAGLYDKIFTAAQGVLTIRDNANKRIDKLTSEQAFNEFDREYKAATRSTADEVEMMFATAKGYAKEAHVERRAYMIAHIKAALAGGNVPDNMKSAYTAKLKELEVDKMKNDAETLQQMAYACGFTLPTNQTEQHFSYRYQMYSDVDDAPSNQEGSMVLFNPKNVSLQMRSDHKITWTDPNNPSVTFQLGKNEAQDIFRRMYATIAETSADELKNPESMQKLRDKFVATISVVAKNSDRDNRMSRMASEFAAMEKSLFGRVPRLSYMIDNVASRSQVKAWQAARKRAKEVIRK